MVRGAKQMSRLMRISRNMAIVRHEGELTLVNPIRLTEAGEEQLRGLGEVKRILRLGAFHGVDDRYYKHEWKAEFWSQRGGTAYPEPAIDRELTPGGELPFPSARLFCFSATKQPESVLLLERGSGLLLTCDGIQHYGDYEHNNRLARLLMPFIGFPKTTIVGPFWLKLQTPEGGSLRAEFDRLLELQFDSLLCGHGSWLESGAKEAVRAAVEKAFA